MLTISETWKSTYPGAAVGILAMRGVSNPKHHTEIEARKTALEEQLRARFAGQTSLPHRIIPSPDEPSARVPAANATAA